VIARLAHGGQALLGLLKTRLGWKCGRDFVHRYGWADAPEEPQVGSELLQALALGPAGPEAGLIEGLGVVFGPDQQQIGLAFAALLGAVAVEEEPEAIALGWP
jgi:hypothetical protein